jgi:RNA polymerase sigma-70 factor (ECF subfamily)
VTEPGRPLQVHSVEGVGLVSAPAEEARLFRLAFEQNFDRVCRNLRRLGVRESDLEDSAHEVFIVVHRNWHRYDRTRPLPPWLFAFTLRVASDYRSRPRYQREVLDEQMLDDRAHVDPLDLEARWIVLQALDTLSDEKRAVLVMHDLEEYTMPEIADVLEIPLNTAYSRLRLARADFKRSLEQLDGHEGGAR